MTVLAFFGVPHVAHSCRMIPRCAADCEARLCMRLSLCDNCQRYCGDIWRIYTTFYWARELVFTVHTTYRPVPNSSRELEIS